MNDTLLYFLSAAFGALYVLSQMMFRARIDTAISELEAEIDDLHARLDGTLDGTLEAVGTLVNGLKK